MSHILQDSNGVPVAVNANIMICQSFDANAKYFDIWGRYRNSIKFVTLKYGDRYLIFVVVENIVSTSMH